MKTKLFLSLVASLALTGCNLITANPHFEANSLPSGLYHKYWAMEMQDNMANIFQVSPDGRATVWRYSCDKYRNYVSRTNPQASQVEHYQLESQGQNAFRLHSSRAGAWASLRVHEVSSQRLVMSQQMPRQTQALEIHYQAVASHDKPLCK
ncbi:hypothetical protein A4G20_04795 [Pasteurellaceae bacterium RH1A]|nr:hypothetical protein A4G20_04795 [Pasteurellaceae bacterium RH1A]